MLNERELEHWIEAFLVSIRKEFRLQPEETGENVFDELNNSLFKLYPEDWPQALAIMLFGLLRYQRFPFEESDEMEYVLRALDIEQAHAGDKRHRSGTRERVQVLTKQASRVTRRQAEVIAAWILLVIENDRSERTRELAGFTLPYWQRRAEG